MEPAMSRLLLRRLFVAAALCVCPFANAAIYCVQNSAELESAFTAVNSSTEDVSVYLKVGTYTASISDGFFAFTKPGISLTVQGGFTAFGFNGAECTSGTQGTVDPQRTILDGVGTKMVLSLTPFSDGTGSISVRYLTLQNGVPLEDYSPVELGGRDNGWAGTLTVENVIVRNINNGFYGSVQMLSDVGKVIVRNSMIVDNSNNEVGVFLIQTDYAGSGAGIVFNNNTVANNHESRVNTNGGLYVCGSADAQIGNNIFWNNTHAGLSLCGSGQYALTHNDIGTLSGTPASNVAPFDVSPNFVSSSAGDYRLKHASPLIDVGDNSVPGGHGSYDAEGLVRVVGTVDLGAMEWRDGIFADGFD